MPLHLNPQLPARVVLPTSKSISARALIIRALADAPCPLAGLSDCDDTQAVIRALGSSAEVVDIGAAGTAMRFLTAYYASRDGETHILTGTARMKQRPIGILVDALRQLGADIDYAEAEGCPPLIVRGRRLRGGSVTIAADVSSQYISALLMLGPTLAEGLELHLEGEIASRPYILMTLRLMEQFGAEAAFDGQTIRVRPGGYRRTAPFTVEPDWSAASYWFELVALSPDSAACVVLPGLTAQSLQGDSVCAAHFAHLGVATAFTSDGAVLTKAPAPLTTSPDDVLRIDFVDCPDLAQTFVVTAALEGRPFCFDGLKSLRIKETDRIAALIAELAKLGITIVETAPGQLSFSGTASSAPSSSSSAQNAEPSASSPSTSAPTIATYADHRMAMAFAPAAYVHPGLVIEHPEVVSKSYPAFWRDLPTL